MMKIEDIKPVGYLAEVLDFQNNTRLQYFNNEKTNAPLANNDLIDLSTAQPLYTAEQMQEYAKAKAIEAILMIDSDWTEQEIEDSFFDELFEEKMNE